MFGSKCYIINDRGQRREKDPKSEETIFLGYSISSRAYRVYNLIQRRPENVLDDGVSLKVPDIVETSDRVSEVSEENSDDKALADQPSRQPSRRILKNHPTNQTIGNLTEGMKTREKPITDYREMVGFTCFTSCMEPKNVKEALEDE